jgi:hypothetical protein
LVNQMHKSHSAPRAALGILSQLFCFNQSYSQVLFNQLIRQPSNLVLHNPPSAVEDGKPICILPRNNIRLNPLLRLIKNQ